MTRWRHFSCVRLCAFLAASLISFAAVPAAAQVTVAITSTPANGTHYVAGEAITTRIDLEHTISSTTPLPMNASRMALEIGGVTRQAVVTAADATAVQSGSSISVVNFTYTVVAADLDSDGISIPANSISGTNWLRFTVQNVPLDRDHAALPAQSAHQVIGPAASIASTTPAALTEANLNGATVALTVNVGFESGVTTASFELVTTMTGVTIDSVSSVSSGDTSATLTLASTADIAATGTLAVKVLAAAHASTIDLTTGTVTVAPVLAVGAGASTSALAVPVREGGMGTWDVVLNADPGSSCTGASSLTIAVTSDDTTAVTVSPATLTFTTANWSTAQTVTATGVADNDLDDATATVGHTVTSACAPSYPTTLAIASVRVAVEDDDTSLITVDAPRVFEGGVGDMPTMDFVVTLAPAAEVEVTVDYSQASGGTAASGTDFTAVTSDTLTFAPGETSKTISVTVLGDADLESDEGVQLFFNNPSPSSVVIATGSSYPIGNIVDDDVPTVRIDSPRVSEGNTGTTGMEFTVTLLPAAAAEVTVDWSDAGDGTATSDSDYQELDGGTLAFAAGETSKTIAVAVRGDGTIEPDETVRVRIQIDPAVVLANTVHMRGADGSIVAENIGVGTIANDDGRTGGPEVVQSPGAVVLAAGDETEIELSRFFADPDGGALTYSAGSNDPEVVSATVRGSRLLLRAGGVSGTTEVSVTATNRRGQTASITMSVEVVGTETACSAAPAEAPEGGTATAVVELVAAAGFSTTVRWHLARDTDPETADADAGDHGDVSGEVQVRAGERCAEIEIDILDDDDAEPAREWFNVVLRGGQLARETIPVAVLEGVCDRTPVVRRALLAATDAAGCEAPASADLHRVSELTLAESGLDTLAAEDFGDLTGLLTLDLGGNGLTALPALPSLVRLERLLLPDNALEAVPLAALPAPERLRELILSDNALSELPANAFATAPGLRSLRLDGNRLEILPEGLFAGSISLRLLRLDGNPGAPFTVRVDLERVDAQPSASPPAMLRAVVPLGAPFETVAVLIAENAAFADGSAESQTTVAGGETAGTPFAADSTGGFAHVALTVPGLPDRQCLNGPCWQGFALEAGAPLTLFARRVLGDEPVPLFGEDLRVSLSSLAEAAELVGEQEWIVRSSDPSLAGVHIAGGHLLVEPNLGAEGDLRVEATATDANGQTTTVYFNVRVEFHWPTRSWREIPIMEGQR